MAGTIRIPDGFVDELKARIRPSDVIGRKVKLTKKGKEWVGLSPFTSEKTPSFYVNDQKRIFKCFSSGLGGDVISFVMETERLSFMEAVEKLAEEAGMQLPKASAAEEEAYDHRKRLQAVCEAAASYFEDCLQSAEGGAARAYLEGRGLPPAAWQRHRIGFAPDSWRLTLDHLKSKGFTVEEILEAGLAKPSDKGKDPYDAFRGRIMFPITDLRGGVIAFGGRAMLPDAKPKYLNSGDTPLFHKSGILYRYKAARESLGHGDGGGLIVCEGYMDAIALVEAGFPHAVAPLGTALTEDQLSLIWKAGPEPVLCFDGDRAGLGAAYRAVDRALPYVEPGRSLFFVLLPDGMDPDDLIRARGAAAMHEAIEGQISLAELLWQRERDMETLDTPERQAGLEARLMAAAGQIKNGAVKAAYERDLKAKMRDHLWQIRQQSRSARFTKRPKTGQGHAHGDQGQAALKSGAPAKLRGLGAVVRAIDSPALLSIGTETLGLSTFPDSDVSLLRDAILDLADSGKPIDREAVSAHLHQSGNMRAARLLNDYPKTPPIAAESPEGREWLIALEQYMAAGRSDELSRGSGMDAASGDATASPSAWRRRHQLVAERRALRARLNDAAGKVGDN